MAAEWIEGRDPGDERDETPRGPTPVRHEDGIPHQSHRWVSVETVDGGWVGECSECGCWIEADEALGPCLFAETPEVAGGEREALERLLHRFLEAVMGQSWEVDTAMKVTAPHFMDRILALLSARPASPPSERGELREAEAMLRAEAERLNHERNVVGYEEPGELERARRLEEAYLKAAAFLAASPAHGGETR